MGKIIVTQEQADKIKGWEWHTKYPNLLLNLHVNNALVYNNCLQSLTLDELARAIYVGYEVEEKFKVGDKVILETGIEKIYTVGAIRANRCYLSGVAEEITNVETSNIRHATESEIAREEKSRMDKKINKIWIDLSDYERNGFYRKLVRGDY